MYRVCHQLFLEVHMLVRIFEVQIHYKIIYFDIDIRILYIFVYCVLITLLFIVSYISSCLIG